MGAVYAGEPSPGSSVPRERLEERAPKGMEGVAPPALTDEQIVEIRDECLGGQGEIFDCIKFARAVLAAALPQPPAHRCRAGRDGDCAWKGCPQLRDKEPATTGRSCPLWIDDDDPCQPVASLPASSIAPPKSDVHLAVPQGEVSGAPASEVGSLPFTDDTAEVARRVDALCDGLVDDYIAAGKMPRAVYEVQSGLRNPVMQVYFRAGLLACREYMARFVEAESPTIAGSIRANWWPSLGADPGAPRQLHWDEVADGGEDGPWTPKDVSPSIEALPVALGFIAPQAVASLPASSIAPDTKPVHLAQASSEAPAFSTAGWQWPKGRDVARCGDMTPLGESVLRIVLDSDNDVCVEAWGSLEFCNGGGGGGQSPNTRKALIALMVAMEQDNAENARKQWPPR